MTVATIPNRPLGTDPRSVSAILADFDAITAVVNGNLDGDNLSALTAQSAGVNRSGQTVKGVSIIATSESRTNVAYGTLTTPDQVSVVLPTNGLIEVWFQAQWQESVQGAGRAAIFIGANQFQVAINQQSVGDAGPAPQAAYFGAPASPNQLQPLYSFPLGLASVQNGGSIAGADATTGQGIGGFGATTALTEGTHVRTINTSNTALGGPCYIDNLAAGTYTISVQFRSTSGSVTASNRRLRARALAFA